MPKYEYDFTKQSVGRFVNTPDMIAMREGLTKRANDRGERIVSAFVIGEEVYFLFEKEIEEDSVLDGMAGKAAEVGSTAYNLATDVAEKTVKGLSNKLGRGFDSIRDKVRRS